MKRKMNTIEVFTFEGILELSESKWGKKYTMGITDILYLHHLKMRNICGTSDESMKKYLMSEGYSTNETLQMIKRYKKVEKDLYDYNYIVQSRMDRANQYLNPSVSFQQVEDMNIGVLREGNGYKVVDISYGEERLLARIKNGIQWIYENLSINQMNYIKENAKLLRNELQGGIL